MTSFSPITNHLDRSLIPNQDELANCSSQAKQSIKHDIALQANCGNFMLHLKGFISLSLLFHQEVWVF
jgi:hypothetical protein